MSCPPDGELVSLAQGKLPPAEAERVGAHARTCATCRPRLSRLAAAGWGTAPEDLDQAPSGGNGKVTGATVPAQLDEMLTRPEFPEGPPERREDSGSISSAGSGDESGP